MNCLRILAMGDNHGDQTSLQRVVDATEGAAFDYVLHLGDITDTSKTDFETGVEQLRSLEPYFEILAERGELVYIHGNRDEEAGTTSTGRHVADGFELTPGHCLRVGESIEVAGQRFTTDRETAGRDDILLTHHDSQRQFYDLDARAYFCGHSHKARQVDRSLNTGYLWKEGTSPGAYFLVELDAFEMSVAVHGLVEPWHEMVCPDHAWYGTQFLPAAEECRLCTFGPDRPFREMATEAFIEAVESPAEPRTATVDEIVTRARELFVDTEDYGRQLFEYLDALFERDRPAPKDPLHPVGDGTATLRLHPNQSD